MRAKKALSLAATEGSLSPLPVIQEFQRLKNAISDLDTYLFVFFRLSKLDASAGFPVAFLSSVKAMASINRASMSCEETPDGMHSSEIRGLCSTKCSSETLLNLLYFMYQKTRIVFFRFSFRATLYFYLMNALVYADIDQGIHKVKTKSCTK